jgi:hypothetical protein
MRSERRRSLPLLVTEQHRLTVEVSRRNLGDRSIQTITESTLAFSQVM